MGIQRLWGGVRWCLLVLAAALAVAALRILRLTWRVREVGTPPAARSLLTFWHGHQLALSTIAVRPTILISRSRDGELGALAARMLGYGVVRGSTSRGAVAGALGLARQLKQGRVVALAADGPRGPRQRAGHSAARLAELAQAEVVPVAALAAHGLTLNTWDRMVVPAPFSRICVVWGEALRGQPLQGAMELAHGAARAALGGAS